MRALRRTTGSTSTRSGIDSRVHESSKQVTRSRINGFGLESATSRQQRSEPHLARPRPPLLGGED